LLAAGDETFEIERKIEKTDSVGNIDLSATALWLRSLASQELRTIQQSDLLVAIGRADIRFADCPIADDENETRIIALKLTDKSEAAQQVALHKGKVLGELERLGYSNFTPRTPTIRIAVKQACRSVGAPDLSVETLYMARRELEASEGDLTALAPRFEDRGGKHGSRLNPLVEVAISFCIAEFKADPDARVTPAKLRNRVKAKLEEVGSLELILNASSGSTLARRIDANFTKYEQCLRNYGVVRAQRLFREDHPRDSAIFPLEVVEIDDTDAKVYLINEQTGLPFGRAFVTPTLDQFTKALLGTSLGHESRSSFSQISSLVNAVLPKDLSDEAYEGVNPIAAQIYGKLGIVVMDNPPSNHSPNVKTAAKEQKFIGQWAKPYTPQGKAIVEGFHAIYKSEFVRDFAGYRGDNLADIDVALARAVVSMKEFRRASHAWMFNVYNNTPKACGNTPYQLYFEGLRQHQIVRRLPTDVRGFKLMATLNADLPIQDGLVWFANLPYSHAYFVQRQKRLGPNCKVTIRYNPNDLARLWVVDVETNSYLEVECAKLNYAAGLTLHQQKLILKLAKEAGERNPVHAILIREREKLRTLTTQLSFSKKIRDRRRAERTGYLPALSPKATQDPIQEPVFEVVAPTKETTVQRLSELESVVSDIDEITFDMSEEGW